MKVKVAETEGMIIQGLPPQIATTTAAGVREKPETRSPRCVARAQVFAPSLAAQLSQIINRELDLE